MANNYIQFSESLAIDTDKQKEWLEKWLTSYDKDMSDEELKKWAEEHGLDDPGEAQYWPGFMWSFEKNPESKHWDMWIREDESGNPDHVAATVQALFKKFKVDSTFTLTWAAVCSKQRIGEFSGGGFIVLPFGKKVEWSMPYMLFDKVHKRIRKQR